MKTYQWMKETRYVPALGNEPVTQGQKFQADDALGQELVGQGLAKIVEAEKKALKTPAAE